MLDAGIVDEDVNRAEGVGRGLHHRFDLVDLGEVRAVVERLDAVVALEARALLFDRVGIAEAVDDDVRALGGERPGISEPDALSGAGDERGLAFEEHGGPFFRW
jgi:hypothetical protein